MKKVSRIALGCLFLVAGLIGFILPVVSGWAFIFAGVVILASDIPFFARLICFVEKRIPFVQRLISRMHQKLNNQRPKPSCPPDET
jgi:uncharacterized membrane protein YbaN (DUF454 family)